MPSPQADLISGSRGSMVTTRDCGVCLRRAALADVKNLRDNAFWWNCGGMKSSTLMQKLCKKSRFHFRVRF